MNRRLQDGVGELNRDGDADGEGGGVGEAVGEWGYFLLLLKFFKFAYAASNGFSFNWLTERNSLATLSSLSLQYAYIYSMQYVYMETVLPYSKRKYVRYQKLLTIQNKLLRQAT